MSISGKTDPVVRPIVAADIAEALVQGLRDFFLGLLVTLPVLGHATWHLYRRIVAPLPA